MAAGELAGSCRRAGRGEVGWSGKNPKLEESQVQGSLRVEGGRVRHLPFLEKLSSITGKKSIEQLDLNECSAEVDWQSPKVEIKNIAIEDEGEIPDRRLALDPWEGAGRRAPARRGSRISGMAAKR